VVAGVGTMAMAGAMSHFVGLPHHRDGTAASDALTARVGRHEAIQAKMLTKDEARRITINIAKATCGRGLQSGEWGGGSDRRPCPS
jgi:hypothetical protein